MSGIVVEDGTGLSDSNSYVSIADADTYFEARGLSDWTSASSSPDQGKGAALIRATAYLDAKYKNRFPGLRVNGRDQALEWPREDAVDTDGEEIAADEIPVEIRNATCEAALRELADPGVLWPDLDRGGGAKRLKAGSVEIEYGAGAKPLTTFTAIESLLAPLIGMAAQYTARAARG